jgi:hypothetical protein
MDNPARIVDAVTAEITRGPMTRLEAIRYMLDTSQEAHHINPTLGPYRAIAALEALGVASEEIAKSRDLP